jgi:hypothetical protein
MVGALMQEIRKAYYRGPDDWSYCGHVTGLWAHFNARLGRACLERGYYCVGKGIF